MDWLRSEDLKEEKNVTTPIIITAVEEPSALCRCQAERGAQFQELAEKAGRFGSDFSVHQVNAPGGCAWITDNPKVMLLIGPRATDRLRGSRKRWRR
jgi:hypothetical protein